MISRRTIGWIIALVLLGSGMTVRVHWEKATCLEYLQKHAYHGPAPVASEGNSVGFSAEDLCQPGELEPLWAKCIMLGAFGAFVGSVGRLIRDVWIWSRRIKA